MGRRVVPRPSGYERRQRANTCLVRGARREFRDAPRAAARSGVAHERVRSGSARRCGDRTLQPLHAGPVVRPRGGEPRRQDTRPVRGRPPSGVHRYLISYAAYTAENLSLGNVALLVVATAFQLLRINEEELVLTGDAAYSNYRQRVHYR